MLRVTIDTVMFSIVLCTLVLSGMSVFFKQKTAYDMRMSDWSSDVCSSYLLGMPATIVMPADAPRAKRDATLALGAEIVSYDRATESRELIAARLAEARGATLVPSFDDPWVIEGQGNTGVEAARQRSEERRVGKECVGTVRMR